MATARILRIEHRSRASIAAALFCASACGDGSPITSAQTWEDFYSGPPPATADVVAEDVAACGGDFFVVGETHGQLIVRAYDAADGTLEWEREETIGQSGVARTVVCDDDRVYASSHSYSPGNEAFLRAYDRESGEPIWDFTVDEGERSEALELAVDDGEVFLLTRSADTPAVDLWMLDGSTGDLLWQARDDGADAPSVYATLTVTHELACTLRDSGSEPRLRCIERASGELAWFAADVGEPGVEVLARPASRENFLAIGRGEGLSGTVAAYDARSGEFLWSRSDFHAITNVHHYGDRVLVTGIDFDVLDPEDPDEIRYFRVTGIDSRGETVWEDRRSDEGVRTSVVSAGRLFVAGEDWQARVYDPQGGRILAETLPEDPRRSRWAWDIAAEGDRYAIVGATFGEDSQYDFAVRAFELTR